MRILVLGDLSSYHTHLYSDTLSKLGFEVISASLESPLFVKTNYKKYVFRAPIGKKNFLRYFSMLPVFLNFAKKIDPDIVISHFISNYGMIGSFIKDKKKILSVWGSDILIVPGKSRIHKEITKGIVRKYDLIHVDAKFVKEILSSEYEIDVEKILIFPYGPRDDFLKIQHVKKKKNSFISHRRIDPDMDPETLIRAFKILKERGFKNFKLIIASDGTLFKKVKDLIKINDLEDTVTLTGRVSHETLKKLLLEAEFYLSASLSDTTSVSLLEALATGCFPIVSNIQGNKEWIQHGINGLLFQVGSSEDLASKIEIAVSNRDIVSKGVEINKRLIKSFRPFGENLKMMISRL